MNSFPEVHFNALSSANALVEDAGAVVVSSVASGLAVGVMHQRWAISQLGFTSHLVWTAVVGFSIWFPFLIYTIEIATGSGLLTSVRTVGYILVLICSIGVTASILSFFMFAFGLSCVQFTLTVRIDDMFKPEHTFLYGGIAAQTVSFALVLACMIQMAANGGMSSRQTDAVAQRQTELSQVRSGTKRTF